MSKFKGGTLTILVVEDSADTRAIIKVELERWGYTVLEAADGREAIEMTGRACPDLILMDLNMPEVDGLTATQAIREYNEHCADVPILAITAYDTFGIEEAARGGLRRLHQEAARHAATGENRQRVPVRLSTPARHA